MTLSLPTSASRTNLCAAVLSGMFLCICLAAAAAQAPTESVVSPPQGNPTAAATAKSSSTIDPTKNTPVQSPPADPEISVLQREIDVIREFQSDILATVYWSLATIAGLTLVLIGFNWFVSHKNYERDRANMLEEVSTRAATLIGASEQTLRAELLAERERTNLALESLRESLSSQFDRANNDLRIHIGSAVDGAKKELAEQTVALAKTLDKRIDFANLRISYIQLMNAEEKGSPTSIATFAGAVLESCIDSETEGYYMQRALEALKKSIDDGGELSEQEIESIRESAKKIPAQYSNLRDAILEKLKTVKIWKAS